VPVAVFQKHLFSEHPTLAPPPVEFRLFFSEAGRGFSEQRRIEALPARARSAGMRLVAEFPRALILLFGGWPSVLAGLVGLAAVGKCAGRQP
jgi:hypothetical protein